MENVPQLLRFKDGAAFDGFVKTLRDGGYAVRWMVAEVSRFRRAAGTFAFGTHCF